jgi:hypothetical protein
LATAAWPKVRVEVGRLFPLPDGVDFATGASLLMTYGTTYHGLVDRGHIKAGDTLLVLGAAGAWAFRDRARQGVRRAWSRPFRARKRPPSRARRVRTTW